MTETHPKSFFKGDILDSKKKAVVVNLARAGTLPSYVCYQTLNFLLDPKGVRQDHIMIARATSEQGKVEGANLGSFKIGGGVNLTQMRLSMPYASIGV
ncbi:MAG: hypothetical protein A2Z20_06525 [Bdellovibrionales bacterium RBG_16_40_8]|nr:MAG: hypothetical protein A2Z20_06525 [Bdellovibrionales bacterium RBG_16_40_8]